MRNCYRCVLLISGLSVAVITGCAEGPLWKTGYYAPWANRQWSEEEAIAQTWFSKKSEMISRVDKAVESGAGQAELVTELATTIRNDNIQLARIEALRQIARLDGAEATRTLESATLDPSPEVRKVAVEGIGYRQDAASVSILNQILRSETNRDVRMAAIRALGQFSGNDAIVGLQSVLVDSDPAIQVLAMDSLASATGADLGKNVVAWQDYLNQSSGSASRVAEQTSDSNVSR